MDKKFHCAKEISQGSSPELCRCWICQGVDLQLPTTHATVRWNKGYGGTRPTTYAHKTAPRGMMVVVVVVVVDSGWEGGFSMQNEINWTKKRWWKLGRCTLSHGLVSSRETRAARRYNVEDTPQSFGSWSAPMSSPLAQPTTQAPTFVSPPKFASRFV